jgi:hypothetical protein
MRPPEVPEMDKVPRDHPAVVEEGPEPLRQLSVMVELVQPDRWFSQ